MMTGHEFERLKRQFGHDVAAWPAPYRQQASGISTTGDGWSPDRDEMLDRLVLEAALMDTDERHMAHRVLAHINAGHGPAFGSFLSRVILRPAAAAVCGTLLAITLAAGGHQMAAWYRDPPDAQLLALATGALPMGELLGLSAGDAVEEAL